MNVEENYSGKIDYSIKESQWCDFSWYAWNSEIFNIILKTIKQNFFHPNMWYYTVSMVNHVCYQIVQNVFDSVAKIDYYGFHIEKVIQFEFYKPLQFKKRRLSICMMEMVIWKCNNQELQPSYRSFYWALWNCFEHLFL